LAPAGSADSDEARNRGLVSLKTDGHLAIFLKQQATHHAETIQVVSQPVSETAVASVR
jgi:hypothetical protein